MKNLIIYSGLFTAFLLISGFAFNQLLTREDVEFQVSDNARGAALGSAFKSEWPWGSYNQWQCFSVADLNYNCADYDYGTLVPSFWVETEQEILHFDVHVEDRLECWQTLSQWRALFDGGKEVCIFAAHMPDVDMDYDRDKPQSLWYINRIKSVGGYWDLFEESLKFRD